MRTSTLSRRELLRWRPREVDHAGWLRRVRAEWDGADREPLRQALGPVADTLREAIEPGMRVLAAASDLPIDGADSADLLDLEALPYPDGSFDAVVSAFGFARAPHALQTAHELARVCRPGGTLALAAWTPRGLPGGLDAFAARPPGIVAPSLWGNEERLRQRLEPLVSDLTVRLRTIRLEFPTADELFAQLVAPPHRQQLREPFDELLARNSASRASAATPARYLLVTATVA